MKILKTHPLLIGKCDRNGNTGSEYSIFKNLDEDVVRQIRELQIDTTVFNYSYHENCRVISRLSPNEQLCVDGNGRHFVIDNEDYSMAIRDKRITQINNKFDITKCIYKTFGDIFTDSGELIIFYKEKSITERFQEMSYTLGGVKFTKYNGISVKEHNGKYGHIMFCYLDSDGNIVNRDYNLDILTLLNNKPIDKEAIVEEIISMIPDVKYKNYGNKWYSNNCNIFYEPNLYEIDSDYTEILTIVIDRDVKSIAKTKIPKKATDSSKNEILQRVLPELNKIKTGEPIDISKYVFISEPKSSKPTLRVQTTEIDESKFDVFYLNEDDEILTNPEIMEVLKNIENSLNIGENEEIITDFLSDYLTTKDLPSFSYDMDNSQEDHSDYQGLVKLPHGCNFTFNVKRGSCVESTWDHTIFDTDIINLELVH